MENNNQNIYPNPATESASSAPPDNNQNVYPNPTAGTEPSASSDSNQGSAPSTPPTGAPSTPPTGIFTGGTATVQSASIPTQPPKAEKSKLIPIIVSVLVVLVLGVGGFFLIRNFTSSKKTIADFEKTMTSIGYSKAQNSSLTYSDSDGAFTTYTISNKTAMDGVAMFYELSSKDKLKNLLEQTITANDSIKQVIGGFDWSKDYNKYYDCNTNSKQATICMGIINRDNTLLIVYYHSDSYDEAKNQSEKVISAMGY